MPVPDPRAGYAAIWFISCFLFFCIAVGGGFLIVYMILPESESTYWLSIAGITLVCLPWLFWSCTCLYRIISRLCGFRIGCAGGGERGGGRGGGSVVNSTRGRNVNSNHGTVNNNNDNDSGESRNNNGAQDGDNVEERKDSGNSVASRESEIPLTSSMAP